MAEFAWKRPFVVMFVLNSTIVTAIQTIYAQFFVQVCVALFLYWRFCTLLVVVLHKNCTRFHNVRSDHLNWASSGFVICVWSLALFMFIYPKTNDLSALACSRYEVHLILLRSAQPILQKQKLGHCTKLSYHFHKQNHAYFKRILDGNNVILINVTLP